MGKSSHNADEFPLLAPNGLYAADIKGDGNCLFNALSDQLYGDQNHHSEIRARVIQYMRVHADYYKLFIDTLGGGAQRRNPKRKTTKAYASAQAVEVSAEELDRVFESHLQQMAKGGTYGDNMEISAFSNAYSVDVKIYQRDFAYVVSPTFDGTAATAMVHIAYHVWEHYSSIRNISGPHSGLPDVSPKLQAGHNSSTQSELLKNTPYTQPWMESAVARSLPYLNDPDLIRRTLEECKGSIDNAVSKLLDIDDGASVSSATDSSSSKRHLESEDEEAVPLKPRKRRDRRTSAATRVASHQARREAMRLASLADEESVKVEDSDIELPLAAPIDSRVTFMPTGDPTSPTKLMHGEYLTLSSQQSETDSSSAPPVTEPKGVQQPRETARARKDKKKLAQKAAARERKLLAAAVANANSKSKNPRWNPDGKIKVTPVTPPDLSSGSGIGIEHGIKTLYI